jgi:tetratricopeptide (TPR) repeat protein
MAHRPIGLVSITLLATLGIFGARADEPNPLDQPADDRGEEAQTNVPRELQLRPKLIFKSDWLDSKRTERKEPVSESDERRDLEEFLETSLRFESDTPLPPFIGCGETVVEIRAPLDFVRAWYYCVKKVEGERLLVVDGESEFWFERKDVASQEQVEKAISRYLAHYSQRSTVWVERAALRTWMRRYEGAISDYSAAIRIHPQRSTLYSARSRLWSYRGQIAPAIDDLTECLELNPASAMDWSSRGRLHYEAREYVEALERAREAK